MPGKVFLITGTSTGFGKELVDIVLQQGDIAVATARNPDKLSFKGTSAKNYLALKLDVTDKKSIEDAFKKTIDTFGRVDVVVNKCVLHWLASLRRPPTDVNQRSAGYGLSGEFEGFSE